MAHRSLVTALSTFALKTKLSCYCWRCEKKLKDFLYKKFPAAKSIVYDLKQEKLTISGAVDPEKVIKELAKNHIKAELFVEESPKPNNPQKNTMQMVLAQQKPRTTDNEELHNDHNFAKDIENLSKLKGMKQVEVTYSKTVKLTYNGKTKDVESDVHKTIFIKHGKEPDDQSQGFCDSGGPSKNPSMQRSDRNGKQVPPEQAPLWPPRVSQPHPVNDYPPSAPPWPAVYGYPVEENPSSCTVL